MTGVQTCALPICVDSVDAVEVQARRIGVAVEQGAERIGGVIRRAVALREDFQRRELADFVLHVDVEVVDRDAEVREGRGQIGRTGSG